MNHLKSPQKLSVKQENMPTVLHIRHKILDPILEKYMEIIWEKPEQHF